MFEPKPQKNSIQFSTLLFHVPKWRIKNFHPRKTINIHDEKHLEKSEKKSCRAKRVKSSEFPTRFFNKKQTWANLIYFSFFFRSRFNVASYIDFLYSYSDPPHFFIATCCKLSSIQHVMRISNEPKPNRVQWKK